MNKSNDSRGKFCPFTMLETTFVVAIILVLAVVSIPYVSRVKTSSSRTTCEYNLLGLGMALKAYSDDFDLYPSTDDLTLVLHQGKYLKSGLRMRCPEDRSERGNTYSVGYMGGHPLTIELDDPLVVCGHHPHIGTLAVFPDTTVGVLNAKNKSDSDLVPITITQGGTDIEPGFTLHNSDAVIIASEDGNDVSVYGEGKAYFISASYDPTAYSGEGLFTITIGYDTSIGSSGSVWGEGSTYVTFQTNTITTKVEVTGSPFGDDSTKLSYARTSLFAGYLGLEHFQEYDLTHTMSGARIASDIPSTQAEFDLTFSSITEK